jgi:D-alanyl-D-alanine carboxypeptidase
MPESSSDFDVGDQEALLQVEGSLLYCWHMKKRTFLKALLASGGIALTAQRPLQTSLPALTGSTAPPPAAPGTSTIPELVDSSVEEEIALGRLQQSELHPQFVHNEYHDHDHAHGDEPGSPVTEAETLAFEADLTQARTPDEQQQLIEQAGDNVVDEYLQKIRNFDADFSNDIYLSESNALLLVPTVQRLERVQSFVGHANFNLLSFEEMLYFARNYPDIGAFTKQELDFLEEIFHADATEYGFFGAKVTPDLNHRILQKDVIKIENSGHYLHRGESLRHFEQIRKDVGQQIQLTSGIRNNVKQTHLFLAKALQSKGNLSKASRSLAPPGHSFHNAGDFDVGKVGLGEQNFTADFSSTEEYQRLIRLGYVDIRYTDDNQFGVRFEPWHIKLA